MINCRLVTHKSTRPDWRYVGDCHRAPAFQRYHLDCVDDLHLVVRRRSGCPRRPTPARNDRSSGESLNSCASLLQVCRRRVEHPVMRIRSRLTHLLPEQRKIPRRPMVIAQSAKPAVCESARASVELVGNPGLNTRFVLLCRPSSCAHPADRNNAHCGSNGVGCELCRRAPDTVAPTHSKILAGRQRSSVASKSCVHAYTAIC